MIIVGSVSVRGGGAPAMSVECDTYVGTDPISRSPIFRAYVKRYCIVINTNTAKGLRVYCLYKGVLILLPGKGFNLYNLECVFSSSIALYIKALFNALFH